MAEHRSSRTSPSATPTASRPSSTSTSTIADGEFIILVGPSGCGKSTALRMIAGLEDITDGELKIGGEVVNDRAPKDRDIAMVFQSYALYPHMTVRENMGFALQARQASTRRRSHQKVERGGQDRSTSTQHLDRKPANLSGGQRQRVAMGRAIVRDPKAFLMDEPLSNLDAKLRVQMRTEVSRIQKRLGTTTVYVTHDQTEAMTLGDRVAVMRGGELQQVGAPQELYERPEEPLRGRLHRLAGDELPAGQGRGHEHRQPRSATSPLSDEQRQRARGRRQAATSSPASAPRTSRTPRWSATSATAASPSRRGSTCSSRWAPSSTPTSRSRPGVGQLARSCRSWPRTPAPPTSPVRARRARSSPGSSAEPARRPRARRPSSGSTRPRSTCSTPSNGQRLGGWTGDRGPALGRSRRSSLHSWVRSRR